MEYFPHFFQKCHSNKKYKPLHYMRLVNIFQTVLQCICDRVWYIICNKNTEIFKGCPKCISNKKYKLLHYMKLVNTWKTFSNICDRVWYIISCLYPKWEIICNKNTEIFKGHPKHLSNKKYKPLHYTLYETCECFSNIFKQVYNEFDIVYDI